MASLQTSRILQPLLAPPTRCSVLVCLAPAAQCAARSPPKAHFSTSPARCKRDNNRNRGLSAVRSTGLRPRQTLSVKEKDFANQRLPKPVKIEDKLTGTPEHGLWDFFKDKRLLQTPFEEQRHGRAWTVGELRSRDWDSLHQLWWVCVKERNRLATEKLERARLQAGYGDYENKQRDTVVQETMKAILDTLAERHQAYTDALELAKRDPSINLRKRNGPQYIQPAPYDLFEADDSKSEAPSEPTAETGKPTTT
ncbi:54S ribosomal protein L4 mitochondrial [Plenodomus lingam]|uniref:mitochondrial 54S ribosomal protein uL29m n=1 Tax=Leptosphaeria maculans TaxID=5022 RepID=UPI003319F60B|nr:54S ribosomal protein L4 mitochondrial [Plenodomus lingam]